MKKLLKRIKEGLVDQSSISSSSRLCSDPSMTNYNLAVQFILLLAPLPSLLFVISSAQLTTHHETNSNHGFLSIDCGSSTTSYTDENSILWIGDNRYIKNGETHDVTVPHQGLGSPINSRMLRTLRAFTTRKKNCYSIEAGNRTQRVLVRASFFYGNYDNKSTPPTFDLHFNGNPWARVGTSLDQLVFYEAVFSVKRNIISVCVAQTQPGHLPFISALEVRSLDTGVYGHIDSDYPLYIFSAIAYGTNKPVRFPEDIYDRIWYPNPSISGFIKVKNSLSITVENLEDNPPKSVVETGMIPSGGPTRSLNLFLGNLLDYAAPIHINTYFSEVSKLSSTQKRSFRVFVNGELVDDGPVIPPYGSALKIGIDSVAPSANTTFVLVPTSDSTLPPLINAMEMFSVGKKMTEGTNKKDVNALAKLQGNFIQLQDWSGDPCLPFPYTWDWVACTSDLESPRVTALHLGNLGLVGTVPDFSEMDALQEIDLHNNSLVLRIPDFLGSFPKLKKLNLADNNFSGTMPSSLSRNENLNLNIRGNPNLCLSCVDTRSRRPLYSGNHKLKSTYMLRIPIILGTLVFFMCFGRYYYKKGRRRLGIVHIPRISQTPLQEIKLLTDDREGNVTKK